jgi:hypothetical protein
VNCYVFPRSEPFRVCGVSTRDDMESHLLGSGVSSICSPDGSERSRSLPFSRAGLLHGPGWLAVYPRFLTRQSPIELRDRTIASGAPRGISLACSRSPWEGITVLTDAFGFITETEEHPAPEAARTNLVFSGMIWVESGDFDPDAPFDPSDTAAFLLDGYCREPVSSESLLLAHRDVLTGLVTPWPHYAIPSSGAVLRSPIPPSTTTGGFIWLEHGVRIQGNCELENCVIMSGASVGEGSRLRNCLVPEGVCVRRNTDRFSKYLTCLGEIDG